MQPEVKKTKPEAQTGEKKDPTGEKEIEPVKRKDLTGSKKD